MYKTNILKFPTCDSFCSDGSHIYPINRHSILIIFTIVSFTVATLYTEIYVNKPHHKVFLWWTNGKIKSNLKT